MDGGMHKHVSDSFLFPFFSTHMLKNLFTQTIALMSCLSLVFCVFFQKLEKTALSISCFLFCPFAWFHHGTMDVFKLSRNRKNHTAI
jgi:hypothetical protein